MRLLWFYVMGVVCTDVILTGYYWEKAKDGYKLSFKKILKYIFLCLCSWFGFVYIYFNKNKLF